MKIKPSIYLSDMYGKAGSGEVRKTRHGYVLQNITIPTNPQSDSQKKQRDNTKTATQYWQKLTELNRVAWQSFATTKLGANRHGVSAILDGYTCFLKVNIVRLNEGKTILKNPYDEEEEVMAILYEEDLSSVAKTRQELLSSKFGALEVGIAFYKVKIASSDSPTGQEVIGSMKVYKFTASAYQLELNDGNTNAMYSCSKTSSSAWSSWARYLQLDSVITSKDSGATDEKIYSAKYTNDNLVETSSILSAESTSATDNQLYSAKYINDNALSSSSIIIAKDLTADDKKIYSAKVINDNFLQLSGGTMSGQLKFSTPTAVQREAADDYIRINGGTGTSPYFMLCGKDRSGQKGYFHICARNDEASSTMSARPDGTLTWAGNDISGNITSTTNTTSSHPSMSAVGKWSSGTITVTKIGRMVLLTFVDVQISTASTSGSLLIATLDSSLKPKINAGTTLFFTNSNTPAGYAWLRPATGEIVIFGTTKTSTSMFGSITYMTN